LAWPMILKAAVEGNHGPRAGKLEELPAATLTRSWITTSHIKGSGHSAASKTLEQLVTVAWETQYRQDNHARIIQALLTFAVTDTGGADVMDPTVGISLRIAKKLATYVNLLVVK